MFNAKKREIERLRTMANTYGRFLDEHHDSRSSCQEAVGPLREKIRAQQARITELEKKLVAIGHAAFKVPEGGS